MNKTIVTRLSGAAAVIVLATTLSACAGGQSVAEACKIAQDELATASSTISSDLSSSVSKAATGENVDFGALFQPVMDGLTAAQSKVTNADVKAPLTAFTDEFSSFIQTLEGFEMPDVSKIDPTDAAAMEKLQAAQEKAQEISTKSQEASTKLGEQAKKLQSVCGA